MSIMDYDDYTSEDEVEDYSTKPVPIWLSICLVIGYIIGGAKLFQVPTYITYIIYYLLFCLN